MLANFSFADNTIGYMIEGAMDKEAILELRALILEKFETHDIINLYLEDQGIDRFTLYSVLMGIVFPLKHTKRFNKVAMVTDRSWIHILSSMNDFFLSAKVYNFRVDERIDAMNWITNE
jgi:hypothetical protein